MKTLRNICISAMLLFSVILVQPVLNLRAATMIEYAKAVTGQLAAGQRNEYTFNGKAGDKLTIMMSQTDGGLNPYLMLYNPQNVLIAEDDNGMGKDNARIDGVVLPADGTYKVVADNASNQDGGSYSLVILRNSPKGVVYYDGKPDTQGREFYQLSRPLDTRNPTYYIQNTQPGFDPNQVRAVIRQAFQEWAKVTPLTFTEVNTQNATFVIQFSSIDGPLNVLGETCPPSSPCHGQIQFDSEEPWVMGPPQSDQDISFLAVATHEFGHAIGLLHSNDASALMYYAYSPYNLRPNQDDIAGAQRLYGQGSGGVNGGAATSVPGGQPPSSGGNSNPEVTGSVDNNNFVHFWDFDVNSGDTVTISMKRTSGNLDSVLVLLDASNHILAYDDDSGGNRDALLRNVKFAQGGTYTVAATRAEQAQGHTQGNYTLTINYGVTGTNNSGNTGASNNPQNNPQPTIAPQGGTSGTVQVSPGQNVDQQTASLDETLDAGFTESLTPETQTHNSTVIREQKYVWSTTWCAKDAATLQKNLADMTVTYSVNGQAVASNAVTQTQPHALNNQTCVDWVALLSNWGGNQLTLTRKMTMKNPVFDGMNIYAAGDYIDQYNVTVQ